MSGDVGGTGLIDANLCSNFRHCSNHQWSSNNFLGYDRGLFPWLDYHSAMHMVEVLAMGMAVAEATTRSISTTRNTVWCHTVMEATVPIRATVIAAAEVPATRGGQTKVPMRKTEATVLPGHKPGKSKGKIRQRIHFFSPFFSPVAYSLCVLERYVYDNVKKKEWLK